MVMTGNELKTWRERHGLTQQQLANEVGVAWVTIARWEMSEDLPSSRRPTALTRPLLERAIRRIEKREGKGKAA